MPHPHLDAAGPQQLEGGRLELKMEVPSSLASTAPGNA